MKGWILACILLCIAAMFFLFCMNGYEYISYTLLFSAILTVIYSIGSPVLKRIVTILLCVGFTYFLFVETLVISNARTDKDPQRKFLIVLGARVMDGAPSLSLQHRLEGTLEYLNRYPDSTAIVSGGQGKGEIISEAQCMHDWLIEKGIPESRILMEDRSTSTMENLRFSWEIIQELSGGPDDVAILSSNYHLYRAKTMARRLGIHPAGVKGVVGYPIYTLGMFIREAFGVTHLWAFGY